MKRLQLSLAMLGLLLFPFLLAPVKTAAFSQTGSTPGATAQTPAGRQAEPPPPAASSSQEQQKQPQVKSYTLTPEKYEKAVAFSRAHYRLYFIQFVYGLLVVLLVLRWKLAPRYRDWGEKVSSRRFLQAVIFAPIFLLTLDLLGLPIDLYSHWLSLKYDISVQAWPSWFWDWTKGELISFVVGIFLLNFLYGVIRRSPRRWWFYFWLLTLPLVLFAVFIAPLVIDPLFNKFEPLEKTQPQLVLALEQMLHRAGVEIPPERMFLMKASEKTKALNAYVTGFGSSKRMVVYDTTIAAMTLPETVFVLGHETGHYVLNHLYKGIAFTAVVLFILFYLSYRGIGKLLARYGSGWGIRDLNDWASLPALVLLLSIVGFFVSPVANSFSRHTEHEADIYGLEVTHGLTPNSSQVAAHSFQILGEVDLADPNPGEFIKIWLYSHPPVAERVRFALDYDPWSKGESPKFVK
ncbi:MAG: M48 family metallopeptidase [Candidatus Acidiferrales bacterium]